MLLTELIVNPKIELIAIILVIIITYLIYFSLVNKLVNYLEQQRMNKLGISWQNKAVTNKKYKQLKIITYVGFSSLQIFVTDTKSNLIYKARMKSNIWQNYTIYNAHNKKVGRIWRITNTYFTRLNKSRAQLFMQKFWGAIRLNYYRLPLQIFYNESNHKLEVRSTINWQEIYGQMAYKADKNLVTCNIKINDEYQDEVLLFYIAYITRFYYRGNK